MASVAIIGAGAAGCFCAAVLREVCPELSVTVFEAHDKPLAKVAITGGGRCNITNSFEGIRSLSEAYPRGERLMKRALKQFSQADCVEWFQSRGVPLVLQDDHCYFPVSQDAMDVVRCLLRAMKGAELRLGTKVEDFRRFPALRQAQGPTQGPPGMTATSSCPAATGHLMVNGESFDFVVVTTGGATKGLPFLESFELEMVPPVPSLFTLNIPDPSLKALMGLVTNSRISLQGTPFKAEGQLLITDWGLSGPATLKLSSYAARHLAENGYKGTISINWLCSNEESVKEQLQLLSRDNVKKQLSSTPLLPSRLWAHILSKSGIREDLRWGEIGTKGFNRLVATLTNDCYPVSGKSRFREEFVTAGGVALSNIGLNTLECKKHPGLYFAGEVLDIDAITGGFNLQAAWTTGYICAMSIAHKLHSAV